MKTALLFGAFDILHEGHKNIFKQLNDLGYEITICLAQDSVVKKLKSKEPYWPYQQRKKALEESELIKNVVDGDEQQGEFRVIELTCPDAIAIGHDQEELKKALEKWMNDNNKQIQLIYLKPFNPHIYKSSLLRNKYD